MALCARPGMLWSTMLFVCESHIMTILSALHRLLPLAGLLLLTLGTATQANASASPRYALIIGNGDYASIGALPNPTADARLISETLDELGFETTLALDTSQYDMKKAIAEFGRTLRNADKSAVGFFYYAGHGVQADGRNYLLPIEATPADKADLDLMGVEANWVLRQMESAGNRTNIIVLDACRNNPFVASNRSLGRGLAQIDAPTGSFISYATAPGKVALDGDGNNSPFSEALAKALPTPGLPIEQIFKQVRVNVIKSTQGAQIPWDSSSLVEDFYIKPEEQKLAQADTYQPSQMEIDLWESVSVSDDPDRISLFLQVYPRSPYAQRARELLTAALMNHSNDAPAPEPPAAPTAANEAEPPVADAQTEDAPQTEEAPTLLAEVPKDLPIADAPAPAATPDVPDELTLFEQTQIDPSRANWQQLLDAYPEGTFADLARAEIAAIDANSPRTDAPTGDTSGDIPLTESASAEDGSATQSAAAETGDMTEQTLENMTLQFDTPLPTDTQADGPRSISVLATGSPLFPPFEGLEESYWKNETCSNCHQWDKDKLCEQGTFYTGKDEAALERLQHPYGGFFKSALKQWAGQGCN